MMSAFPVVVEESCHARVGLMGNPSDGFKGKTLSFLLANFKATVRIEARDKEHGIEIAEPIFFDGLDSLRNHAEKLVSFLSSIIYCTRMFIIECSTHSVLSGVF